VLLEWLKIAYYGGQDKEGNEVLTRNVWSNGCIMIPEICHIWKLTVIFGIGRSDDDVIKSSGYRKIGPFEVENVGRGHTPNACLNAL
jgi:acyl-coenzyme A synthetase/AMP-(fatty) acid ligase